MAGKAPAGPKRERLDRGRVVSAAVAVADADGMEGVTMRSLASALEVVPMALYKHVANKDELLDAMVDTVFEEVRFSTRRGWRPALRQRAVSMRRALLRHRWAIGLMESGTPGPANLRHHNDVLGCLRQDAGLDLRSAVHAYSLMDAYIYGFALQERNPAIDIPKEARRRLEQISRRHPTVAEDHPHLAEVVAGLTASGHDLNVEFEFGLDLILTAVAGLRPSAAQERDG